MSEMNPADAPPDNTKVISDIEDVLDRAEVAHKDRNGRWLSLVERVNWLIAAPPSAPAKHSAYLMAIKMLVAAGYVTEAKADEALNIASGFSRGPLAPPSAPVGELVSALQSMRDRMMAALPPKFGDAFDGDFDTMLEAIRALKKRTAPPSAPVGVEDLVTKWRDRADNIAASDDYNAARKGMYEHCADMLEDALVQHPCKWCNGTGLIDEGDDGTSGVRCYHLAQQPAAEAQAQGGGEAVQRVAAFVVEYQRRVAAQTRGGLHHDTIYTLGTNDAPLELRVSDLAAMLAAAPPSAPDPMAGDAVAKSSLTDGQIIDLANAAFRDCNGGSLARMDNDLFYLRTVRAALAAQPAAVDGVRPLDDWHEDDGPVVWWKLPVDEPAWIGTPLDSDWPGYHTHWTPHPAVPAIAQQEDKPCAS